MKQTNKLTDMKNIGRKIAARLNEAGIFTEKDLSAVGAVEAHRRIKQIYPNETLPLCYYLYTFEGAIAGVHWDAIGEKRKRELKQQISGSIS